MCANADNSEQHVEDLAKQAAVRNGEVEIILIISPVLLDWHDHGRPGPWTAEIKTYNKGDGSDDDVLDESEWFRVVAGTAEEAISNVLRMMV